MKQSAFVISMFLGASSAIRQQGVTGSGFPGALDFKVSPAANTCTNANKATTDDEDCSTAGNSAWNTITSSRTGKPVDAMAAPYPGHAEHVQLESNFRVAPAANTCTNANKATTDDEDCSTPGNSAWNTITTSRTAKPADAMAPPYPGHAEHFQYGGLSQFDSGSSIDHFPPYVPTNNAYPKIYDGRAKTAPAVETQTPPADTAAPESVGWYKDAWYSSGSKHSFGNLLQLESEGVTGSGFPGALDFKVSPAANTCTNANKATTDDEDCSTAGNSAWNTITSSRTAKPADAMASPYPGHTEH